MRTLGAIALVSLFAACGSVPSAAPAMAVRPTLRLVDRQPLILRGEHFRAGERARVVLSTEQRTLTHRVTASATGAFSADFGEVQVGRCEAIGAFAVGSRGSAAVLKLPLPPLCSTAGSTG